MLGRKTKISAGVALAFAGALMFSACAGGTGSEVSSTPDTEDLVTESPSETPMETMDAMDPMATLVGAGCAGYAEQVPDGDGSVAGMSVLPVSQAAAANPLLTQLTAAISGQLNPGVDLVDTLNGGEFTVFAPVDEAFGKIDAATLETLKTDSALLTSILTYHVLPERLDPDAIVGTHPTVQGGDLEVTGSADELVVNGSTAVICGGVQTENATVYLIDTVLMPPM